MANRLNILIVFALLAVIALVASRNKPAPTKPIPAEQAKATSAPPATTWPDAIVPEGLPNLRIVDILYESPQVKVRYVNDGGDRVAADFVIELRSANGTTGTDYLYRAQVPPPGVVATSVGFSPGWKPGETLELAATIDAENRVAENDETDNTVTLTLGDPNRELTIDGRPDWRQDSGSWRGPDLITTDVGLNDNQLTVTIANQGSCSAEGTFDIQMGRPGYLNQSWIYDVCVPEPGEQITVSAHSTSPLYLREESLSVHIVLDPKNEVAEGREDNNRFLRVLGGESRLQEWKE